MKSNLIVPDDLVRAYWNLFVNRLAYTVQSPVPHAETGKRYYYRPKRKEHSVPLSHATVRRHLEGELTIGLYAINPSTQRCRWVAIDADYEAALEDLLKLQWELRQDGVNAALEKSRRGGHLWILAEEPLLARDCRVYIYNLASRLKVPVKGAGLAKGVEVFAKQEKLQPGEFGNALRGPLGIHRGAKERFWFYSANYTLEAQMAYLLRLKKITESDMTRFVQGLEMPPEFARMHDADARIFQHSNANRSEFRILDYVGRKRRIGRDYYTPLPFLRATGARQKWRQSRHLHRRSA